MRKTSSNTTAATPKSTSDIDSDSARQFRDDFTADHQFLTRGLLDLLNALQENDFAKTRELAQEIDEKAGAHIQFEEEHLYPELVERRDPAFVIRLYHEHELGREAIDTIVNRPSDEPFSENQRSALMSKLQIALEHAYTCGSLLSYASNIDLSVQSQLLEELHHCRVEARRWSQLPHRKPMVIDSEALTRKTPPKK
ncbi:MAG: hemerythrin domain-containing protein [Planctomycetaceae bacterium]